MVTQCGDQYGVTGQQEHCHWGPQWWGVPGHLPLSLVSLALFLAICASIPGGCPGAGELARVRCASLDSELSGKPAGVGDQQHAVRWGAVLLVVPQWSGLSVHCCCHEELPSSGVQPYL